MAKSIPHIILIPRGPEAWVHGPGYGYSHFYSVIISVGHGWTQGKLHSLNFKNHTHIQLVMAV